MGIWATTQVKYGGRIWSVSGCSCNGWFKNLSQATNLERNKCRHRQCNQLQNLLRLWAELTLHWPFSFSQQRCHPHHRVNVSFFPISIALSFILFSLSLSLSLSASASLFCDSILYLSFCLYLSLFLLIFWFFDFSISRFLDFQPQSWHFHEFSLALIINLCAPTYVSLQMSYLYWKTSNGVIDRHFDRCVDPSRDVQVFSFAETETARKSQETSKKKNVLFSYRYLSFLIKKFNWL